MNGDVNEEVLCPAGPTREERLTAMAAETRIKVQPDLDERRRRSFRAYLDLLGAAEWLRRQFAEQLESFDLTIDLPRRGRRMGRVSLTESGERFMHVVFPRHAKLVFAFFRALDMREQESLSRNCRKLREGDVMKMLNEITLEE